jgi:hypothetical protein
MITETKIGYSGKVFYDEKQVFPVQPLESMNITENSPTW